MRDLTEACTIEMSGIFPIISYNNSRQCRTGQELGCYEESKKAAAMINTRLSYTLILSCHP